MFKRTPSPKMSAYSIRIKFGEGTSSAGPINSNIKKTVKGLEAKFTKRINDYFRRNFGMNDFYRNWKKEKFQQTKEELSTKFVSSLSTNNKYQRKLLGMYAQAWLNKYKATIKRYRSIDPGYTQKTYVYTSKTGKKRAPQYRSHYRMKKNAVSGASEEGSVDSRGSGRPIKFTTWALASGNLRDEIYYGFKGGLKGSGPVKVSSLAVQGAYSVDWDFFPVADSDSSGISYPVRFMNYLIRIGVIDDYEDFIDFLPGDWNEISNYIMGLLSTDFTDTMRESFNSLSQNQKQ